MMAHLATIASRIWQQQKLEKLLLFVTVTFTILCTLRHLVYYSLVYIIWNQWKYYFANIFNIYTSKQRVCYLRAAMNLTIIQYWSLAVDCLLWKQIYHKDSDYQTITMKLDVNLSKPIQFFLCWSWPPDCSPHPGRTNQILDGSNFQTWQMPLNKLSHI